MTFIPNEADAGIDGEQAELDSVDLDVILDGFRLRGVKSGCAVTAGSGLQTVVASGSLYYDGVTVACAGGTLSHAAAGSQLRFDLVVADSSGTLSIIDGTAFYSATYGPSLPTYSSKVVLAVVAIPANATSLTSSNITDHRITLSSQWVLKEQYAAQGDILYASAANTPTRLPIGVATSILLSSGTSPYWATASALSMLIDHGLLLGLSDDDHVQYLLLAGRAAGQTAYGGIAAGEDLTLLSTSHATKGDIFLGVQSTTAGFRFSEVNDRASIGGGNIQHTVGGVNRNAKFEVHSEGGTDPMGFVVHRHSNNDAMTGLYSSFRSRGTHAAPTIVTDGDHAGKLDAYGYDGTDYEPVASIHFEIDGTPGNNDMPGRLVFYTTADGSATLTERARINNAGGFLVAQYGRVGALTVPTYTNTGDFTANRGIFGSGQDIHLDSGASLAALRFDGANDKLEYNQASNTFNFKIADVLHAAISAVSATAAQLQLGITGAKVGVLYLSTDNTDPGRLIIEGAGADTDWRIDGYGNQIRLLDVVGTENTHFSATYLRHVGYMRVGSLSAPVNITAGDLTAGRFNIGNSAFTNADQMFNVSKASFVPSASFNEMDFNVTVAPDGTNRNVNLLSFTVNWNPTAADSGAADAIVTNITHGGGAFAAGGFYINNDAQMTLNRAGGSLNQHMGYRTLFTITNGAITGQLVSFQSRLLSFASANTVASFSHFQAVATPAITGAITSIFGVSLPNFGRANVTNAIAIDIAAQSGAATLNFAIRNAGNSVQTGYARFGAVTIPGTWTANGDVGLVRLGFQSAAGTDDANFWLNITSSNPRFNYDSTDFMDYVRASNYWEWQIASTVVARLGGSSTDPYFELQVSGTLAAAAASTVQRMYAYAGSAVVLGGQPRFMDSNTHDSGVTLRGKNSFPVPLTPYTSAKVAQTPTTTQGRVGLVTLTEPIMLHSVSFDVSTASAGANGITRVGIYNESGGLITSVSSTAGAVLAVGVNTLTLGADVYLPAGRYYIAILRGVDYVTTQPIFSCYTQDNTFQAVTGQEVMCGTFVAVGGALPDPLGTITSADNSTPMTKFYGAAL